MNELVKDERVSSRTLKPSQRKALERIVRFYKRRNDYNEVTSVRFKLTNPYLSVISVQVCTFRSDCGRNSPRAVFTEQSAHFFLGPRGKIKVANAKYALKDETKWVRKQF